MKPSIAILIVMLSFPAVADPITADRIRVIDGDTIRIDGSKPDVRLIGYNAPETRGAMNAYERDLGGKATGRLREIVRTSKLDIKYSECVCAKGAHGTPACNYGRLCGTLSANGRDVGDILIREGLAVEYFCTATRCRSGPMPWREPNVETASKRWWEWW